MGERLLAIPTAATTIIVAKSLRLVLTSTMTVRSVAVFFGQLLLVALSYAAELRCDSINDRIVDIDTFFLNLFILDESGVTTIRLCSKTI